MKIVFATNNNNKLREIRQILAPGFTVLSLADIHCLEELPETSPTIEENATQKARFVYENFFKKNLITEKIIGCFADDTGLEIEALDGRPGVFSARYAGVKCIPEENIEKVLGEMKGIINRNAKFRCVLSLIIDGAERQFEGVMEGKILNQKQGTEGFGYDPIFAPKENFSNRNGGEDLISFAQMLPHEKNRISHRGIAVNKLAAYLLSL